MLDVRERGRELGRHHVRDLRIGTRAALPTSMRTFGFGAALLVSVVLLLVVWLVGRATGFHVSLLGSLGLTVALTIIVNLVVGAMARRNRRF